jgi:hypothetical protein
MVNWKGMGGSHSWLISRYHSTICLQGSKENHKRHYLEWQVLKARVRSTS